MNFIGLDLGTGAVKGVVWDGEKVVYGNSVEVAFIREGDAVEIDTKVYRESVLKLIRDLAAASDAPVAGIAMCAASGNTLVTAADGTARVRVLMKNSPGIVNLKLRLAYDPEKLSLTGYEAGDLSGLSFGPDTANPFTFSWTGTRRPM